MSRRRRATIWSLAGSVVVTLIYLLAGAGGVELPRLPLEPPIIE